jgi:DNA modification methylase
MDILFWQVFQEIIVGQESCCQNSVVPVLKAGMQTNFSQQQLILPGIPLTPNNEYRKTNTQQNRLNSEDRHFHDWYRFVLSFPPHLVRHYLHDFQLDASTTVLDPFCGTGTTLVEAKLQGIQGIGLEVNPFAHFASSVKLDWQIAADILEKQAQHIAKTTLAQLQAQGLNDNVFFTGKIEELSLKTLAPEAAKLLLKDSISPLPLHKVLVLWDCLHSHHAEPYYRHTVLALANALVFSISNLKFGPEVGVGRPKVDIPVVAAWLAEIRKMARDLRAVSISSYPASSVFLSDARECGKVLPPASIDAVITSPPYPNEKDYTRTTRLESVILGFIKNMAELRASKKQFLRSNTRGVYKDDDDDKWIADYPEIQRVADTIEQRRRELGKTSGFEKQYHKVTRQYFGGMARHFAELRQVLRPGARLAYVVGDQASYFQVLIRTGALLADIAQNLGYELIRIDLFRTRLATATKAQLREEVVVLRWPGVK